MEENCGRDVKQSLFP